VSSPKRASASTRPTIRRPDPQTTARTQTRGISVEELEEAHCSVQDADKPAESLLPLDVEVPDPEVRHLGPFRGLAFRPRYLRHSQNGSEVFTLGSRTSPD